MSCTNISIPDFNELDFRIYLGWEMVENILDGDTEAGGGDGRHIRAIRGFLGRI